MNQHLHIYQVLFERILSAVSPRRCLSDPCTGQAAACAIVVAISNNSYCYNISYY